jgi:hypothetical protein
LKISNFDPDFDFAKLGGHDISISKTKSGLRPITTSWASFFRDSSLAHHLFHPLTNNFLGHHFSYFWGHIFMAPILFNFGVTFLGYHFFHFLASFFYPLFGDPICGSSIFYSFLGPILEPHLFSFFPTLYGITLFHLLVVRFLVPIHTWASRGGGKILEISSLSSPLLSTIGRQGAPLTHVNQNNRSVAQISENGNGNISEIEKITETIESSFVYSPRITRAGEE